MPYAERRSQDLFTRLTGGEPEGGEVGGTKLPATMEDEAVALLTGALALYDRRRAFEAALARPRLPRRRGETAVAIGPKLDAENASLPFLVTRSIGRAAVLGRSAAWTVMRRERRTASAPKRNSGG